MMSDKLCDRLTINYLKEIKAVFIYIGLLKWASKYLKITPSVF